MSGARSGRAARRRVVAGFAALGLWWGAWGAALPGVQRSAGVGDAGLGGALLLVGVGALTAMRATGSLFDRFGDRVVAAAIVGLALAGIAPGAVVGVAALGAALFAVGAASGAVDVAVNAKASTVESAAGRPVLALGHAAFSSAVIAGSLVTGGLRSAGATPLAILAGAGAVVAVLGAWSGSAGPAGTRPSRRRVPSAGRTLAPAWRWHRPPRPLVVLGGLLALAFFVEGTWQTWAAVHLERDLDSGPGLAAAGPAVFGAAAGAARLLAHRLARPGAEHRAVAAGAALAAGGTMAAATLEHLPGVLAGIAAAGFGTGNCAPALLGLAGRWAGGTRRGAAVGTVTTLGYLGFLAAPAVIGGVAAATTLPAALASVSLVAAALAVGGARARPVRRAG